MKCNQICKWNSNVGCVKPYGVPCILANVSPTDRKATNADRIRAMSDEELAKEFAGCAIGLYCDTRKNGLPELPKSVKQEVFDSLLEWLKQPAEGE